MKGTGLLEGTTILGVGQEIYKMSLGYLVVPESKEMLNFFFKRWKYTKRVNGKKLPIVKARTQLIFDKEIGLP